VLPPLEAERERIEGRLTRGNTLVFGERGLVTSLPQAAAARKLSAMVAIWRSDWSAEQKVAALECLGVPAGGLEAHPAIPMGLGPSPQLDARLRQLAETTHVRPLAVREIPLVPPSQERALAAVRERLEALRRASPETDPARSRAPLAERVRAAERYIQELEQSIARYLRIRSATPALPNAQ
jgi:hypothetical protein